jgi:hypothetical protein
MTRLQKQGVINKCFSIAKKWKNKLVLLPQKFLPAHVRLNLVGSAFRESRLLYLAVKLDIADLLADLAVPVDLLAKDSDINADNLYRILRTLVSMGIFKETQPKVFANNSISLLLCRANKHNLRQHILNENNASKSSLWFNQLEARLRMQPDNQPRAIEHNFFTQGDSDSSIHEPNGKVNMFEGFDWSTFDLVFDVGNANGEHVLDMFLSSKNLNICIYDNSAAISSAKIFWQGKHIKETNIRLSFEPGNIFKSLPKASSQRNLYCFVSVFSGLSDKDCLTILDNIKFAMANFDATVAIVDIVLPIVGLESSDALDDIQLLLENGGEHRTLDQWHKVISQTDLSIVEVVELRSSNKIIVLQKT